jgi:hypothetical protein
VPTLDFRSWRVLDFAFVLPYEIGEVASARPWRMPEGSPLESATRITLVAYPELMPDTGTIVLIVALLLAVGGWWRFSKHPEDAQPSQHLEQHEPEPDLRALLDGLPESARAPLERMIAAHERLEVGQERAAPVMMWGSRQPEPAWQPNATMLGTELVSTAAPLALEVARLEEYLERYDLPKLRFDAVRDPIRAPLVQDLEEMMARRAELLEALELAAMELESGSASRIEAVTDQLHAL